MRDNSPIQSPLGMSMQVASDYEREEEMRAQDEYEYEACCCAGLTPHPACSVHTCSKCGGPLRLTYQDGGHTRDEDCL